MKTTDPSALVARLAARDPFARRLGIRLVDGGLGEARVRLEIRAEHLNFNGTCHGGVIFSLADTAFGLASNSHGRTAAAIDAHVSFNTPLQPGDTVTAAAREVSRGRRIATYSVEVAREDGRTVSLFTGTVFVLDAAHAER